MQPALLYSSKISAVRSQRDCGKLTKGTETAPMMNSSCRRPGISFGLLHLAFMFTHG